ncbi:MAG: hypothetical protein GY805_37515 [Chloroflexi bacterium]|nr:hypothetical protein [Chloroflexota bacterium]
MNSSRLHSRYMVLTDQSIAHNESNSNPLFTPDGRTATQKTGRIILDVQDAIVIMSRNPLLDDSTYTAHVVVDGESHIWSFSTVCSPANN